MDWNANGYFFGTYIALSHSVPGPACATAMLPLVAPAPALPALAVVEAVDFNLLPKVKSDQGRLEVAVMMVLRPVGAHNGRCAVGTAVGMSA